MGSVGFAPISHALQIPTLDSTKKRRQITRKKLAAAAAKSMRRFLAVGHGMSFPIWLDLIRLHQREKLCGHGDGRQRCGWEDVSLEDVFLTRMVRVSTASWQPEIRVRRSLVASQVGAATSSSAGPVA